MKQFPKSLERQNVRKHSVKDVQIAVALVQRPPVMLSVGFKLGTTQIWEDPEIFWQFLHKKLEQTASRVAKQR